MKWGYFPAITGTFGQLLSCEIEAEWLESKRQRTSAESHPRLCGEKGEAMIISQRAEDERRFSPGDHDRLSEREEEARRIRRLQLMISMVMSVIGQDPNLTVEEASELAAGAKRAALTMFPDKELAFDLIYRPRLQRLIRERFRLQ